MPDFFELSEPERLDALDAAADKTGLPPHLLEKDIWVVWALRHLFSGPYREHLVFKGGTSLSKAFQVIRRFSEDVDLTYDIRVIAGDMIGHAQNPLPATRSQEKKWTKEIRARLAEWVVTKIVPGLTSDLEESKLRATVRAEDATVFIDYEPMLTGTGYVKPAVRLEFGARSTGEPCTPHDIVCDAAPHVRGIEFPKATPLVMRAERTFWEKATAIHVFCAQGEFRGGERFARHWHDVTRLDAAGFAASAIADKALAKAVADHKTAFFAEKDAAGKAIDYHRAVSGSLELVPQDKALVNLSADYREMVADGLFLEDVEPFDQLIAKCQTLQAQANKL